MDGFWKAIAVPIGFTRPVPAPMKNCKHPLRSGLDCRLFPSDESLPGHHKPDSAK